MYSAGAYTAVYEQRAAPRVETESAREVGGRVKTVVEALVLAHVCPEGAKTRDSDLPAVRVACKNQVRAVFETVRGR